MFNQLVFVFVFCALIGTSSAFIGAIIAAVTTAVGVINEITALVTGVDGVLGMFSTDDSDEQFQNSVMQKLDHIYAVCGKIDDISKQINDLSIAMKDNTEKTVKSVEFNRAKEIVADFKKNIDYINNIYKNRFSGILNTLKTYIQSGGDNARLQGAVCDFGLDRSMSELYSDITSSLKSQSSIFTAMSQYYDTQNGYKFQCENISPMDELHIFCGDIVTTFTKGFAVMMSSQKQFQMISDDDQFYHNQQNTTLENFKEAIEGIIQHAKIGFDSLHSDYRGSFACDPSEWKEGENFIRVKNYISLQIFYNRGGSVVGNAEEIAASKEYDCEKGYAVYSGVPGAKYNTESFVCEDPFSPKLKNPNKVQYRELKNPLGRIWESRKCGGGIPNYDYQYCAHDLNSDPFLSIRKLSLRLQECDISQNEVVTDLRFYEKDNKIHIKLRCGVCKDGKIDPETLRWTEDDSKPFSDNEYAVLSTHLKTFNLDNVVVGNTELVTGVGFEIVDKHSISLVVKGTKVNNYYKGTAFGEGKIYSAPNLKKPRRNINITDLERPLKKTVQSYQISKQGEDCITMTLSKRSFVYYNQAIVPYFTMTAFNPDLSVLPLGGIGLIYKTPGPEYTGFLAFKHLAPIYVNFVDIAATTSSLQDSFRR